jgi:hypothetical protein
LVKDVVQCIENGREMPKITVLDAVRKLAEVWETQVKETTIFNCFKKAGFIARDVLIDQVESSETINEGSVVENCDDWAELNQKLGNDDLAFGDYLEVDENVMVCDILTDEDIIEAVTMSEETSQNKTEECDMDMDTDESIKPTEKNIKTALSVLERGLYQKPNIKNEDFASFFHLKKLFN